MNCRLSPASLAVLLALTSIGLSACASDREVDCSAKLVPINSPASKGTDGKLKGTADGQNEGSQFGERRPKS